MKTPASQGNGTTVMKHKRGSCLANLFRK